MVENVTNEQNRAAQSAPRRDFFQPLPCLWSAQASCSEPRSRWYSRPSGRAPPWLWSPSGGAWGAGRFCAAGSTAGGGLPTPLAGRESRFEWRAERRNAGCLMSMPPTEGRHRSGGTQK